MLYLNFSSRQKKTTILKVICTFVILDLTLTGPYVGREERSFKPSRMDLSPRDNQSVVRAPLQDSVTVFTRGSFILVSVFVRIVNNFSQQFKSTGC